MRSTSNPYLWFPAYTGHHRGSLTLNPLVQCLPLITVLFWTAEDSRKSHYPSVSSPTCGKVRESGTTHITHLLSLDIHFFRQDPRVLLLGDPGPFEKLETALGPEA